jgi:hypothetical protein
MFRMLKRVSIISHVWNLWLGNSNIRESLYCLVLGSASRAVGASDRLDMATALLVTPAITNVSVPDPNFNNCKFIFWTPRDLGPRQEEGGPVVDRLGM